LDHEIRCQAEPPLRATIVPGSEHGPAQCREQRRRHERDRYRSPASQSGTLAFLTLGPPLAGALLLALFVLATNSLVTSAERMGLGAAWPRQARVTSSEFKYRHWPNKPK
jgi:hypothetical protein